MYYWLAQQDINDLTALGWFIMVAGAILFVIGYSMTQDEGWFGRLGAVIEGLGAGAILVGALITWG